MTKILYDLHIHSALSPCADNDMTPVNIGAMSSAKGLQIIAVADHNAIANVAAAREVGEALDVLHFRSLPFQIGDKHVPVSTSADLRFKDVVKLVLCLIRLFQSVTFDILLAVCHVQAVFQGKFLADTGVA